LGADLLINLKEQEGVSKKVLDLQTANRSRIHAWQGKAIVTEKTIEKGRVNANPSDVLKYSVDFALDVANGYEAWDSQYSTNHIHARENCFVRDGVYYFLLTGHPKDGRKTQRQLSISPTPLPLVKRFDPFAESLPLPQSHIEFRLSKTILEPRMAQRKESGISDDENEKFLQDVLTNGFKDYKFRLDGDILTRELMLSGYSNELFTVNFAQSASFTTYRLFGSRTIKNESIPIHSWDAEYQKINQVWVPQKTKQTILLGDDGVKIKEIEWTNQTINYKIPHERFSVQGIGAVHGMEVIDYRINKAFKATGEEYPPEYDLTNHSFSHVRWIFMGIGFLFILAGGIGIISKKMRKTV